MKALQDRLDKRRSREIQKLSSLLQISQAVAGTLDLRTAFQDVFETLSRHHDAVRSALILVNKDTREATVEAVAGPGRPPQPAALNGGSVIGRVIESGKHVVVPRMTAEPGLMQQIFGRQDGAPDEHSFLCVPVSIDREPVGALGVTVQYLPDRNYDRSTKFFSIVASLIAQAVKVQRLVAAQHKRLVTENARLKQELREGYDFANIVGNSGPMQRVYEAVAQVARTNTTVLIRGESGTGKELIAQAMHYNSLRAKRAFVKVSCGALPETLIESELFGHEKGAFTGAQDRKRGRFELAQNGTHLPRRDRRRPAGHTSEAAPCPPGAGVRAPGRHRARQGERPADCRDEQEHGKGDRGRRVPRGPLLPIERLRDLHPAPA